MFWQRAAITFTLGPLALFLIYLGGWFYFLPVAGLLIIAVIEYSQLMTKIGWRTPLWLLIPSVLALWLLAPEARILLFGDSPFPTQLSEATLAITLLAAVCYGLYLYEFRPSENAPAGWLATSMGTVLIGWIGAHFFRLRGLPLDSAAWQWTATAMLGTWVADSGAYVFGKTMGRHKLSPRLSPNKTIEGYFGSLLTGTLITTLLALYFDLGLVPGLVLGLLISGFISPAGDLGISLLKRNAGVKDSGNLLPGHGGALDRIDSLVWSVTMAYYLVLWLY
jgi:phosphatidate cytidylyltransferase